MASPNVLRVNAVEVAVAASMWLAQVGAGVVVVHDQLDSTGAR